MYQRVINFDPYIDHKSLFLLGPRQAGKSTLLRQRFPKAQYIDLLNTDVFRTLLSTPEQLRERVSPGELVIIDEIQKLPTLLNEVQWLIDNKDCRFLLTGSSARKLKRGNANLLGGRALFFHLYPLTSHEIGYDNLSRLLEVGGLPGIVDSPIAWEELKAYVGAYLREEIQAEALTRSIENFSRFLDIAIHFNAEQINYTKIGNDAEVPPRTIKDYVKILEDTLIIHVLPPFKRGSRRKTASMEKIYFFDIGVAHAMARRQSIQPGTPEYGKTFEHFVFLELQAAKEYQRKEVALSFWRTHSNLEVDFIVDDRIAIEVKGTGKVSSQDTKPLLALDEEIKLERKIIVCNEKAYRTTETGIEIMPISLFCEQLWEEDLLGG